MDFSVFIALSQHLFEGRKGEEEHKKVIFLTQKQISILTEDLSLGFWLWVIITSHTLNKTFL
jgi:hypothetical protein